MRLEYEQKDGNYIIKGYDNKGGSLSILQEKNSFTQENFKSEDDCKDWLKMFYTLNEDGTEIIESEPPIPDAQPVEETPSDTTQPVNKDETV